MTEELRALRQNRIEHRRVLELVEKLLEVRGARDESKEALTLRDVYEDWLKRRKRRGLRNVDNERTQLELHVLPLLGDVPLVDVRVRHIRDCVAELRSGKLAARTVRSIYGTLHKLFADLVVDEILSATPCVLTKDQLPKLRDKDPEWRVGAVFTRAELELLISAPQIPLDRRVLNAIKLLTGARLGEVVGLRWRDLDEAAAPLMRLAIARSYNHGTKTDAPRLVPVHPVLAKILMEWKREGFVWLTARQAAPDDLIVPSRRGRMRSRHQHRNKFLEDLKRLGLRKRRVHDTRRTFITLARVDGARRDVLEQITHAPKRSIMDLYTSLPWPTLCDAVRCLRIRRLSGRDVRWRLATIREAQREEEKKRRDSASKKKRVEAPGVEPGACERCGRRHRPGHRHLALAVGKDGHASDDAEQ